MKKKTKIIFGIIAMVIFGTVISLFTVQRNNIEEIRTVTVERRTVAQDVTFTGRLESKQMSNLAFELAGTVQEILVDIGDPVQKGELLAYINSESSQLELSKARADRLAAQDQQRRAWQSAEDNWKSTVKENDQTLDQQRQAVRDGKIEMDHAKTVWQQKVIEGGDEASATKAAYSTFLTDQSLYRAAQESLTTKLATVAKYNETARNVADEAQARYLATIQAATGDPGIAALKATERIAGVRLSKSVMRAPFDGMVTKKEFEAGEVIGIGQTVLTVETIDALELTADVTETDAAKLAVGMESTISFDAFDSDNQWDARITRIAPAATLIEGVPTYEVTFEFPSLDPVFKPGLTANITVHAAKAENVLSIPRRAIATQNGKKMVRVLSKDGIQTEQEITTGLVGSDGSVEVQSGLLEGELIIPRTPSEE